MRILVFGAGVLGCNLAHCFFKAGKDVTLLARGKWGETIKEDGLVIKNQFPSHKTKDRIKVIDSLMPEDQYDIIFVVARYSQLNEIIPILNQNRSEYIVLVGNNVSAEECAQALPNKKVLFAFSSSAGHRESDKVVSINMSKMTVGSLDGSTDHEPLLKEVFAGMKYKLTYCNYMGDWLLTHAAFILPICYACYYAEGNLKKIKKDEVFLNKIIDATIEAYDALKAIGCQILPEGDYEYVTERKKFMKFLKLSSATFLGKIMASDHAMNAVDEMTELSTVFVGKIKESNTSISTYMELFGYLEKYSKTVSKKKQKNTNNTHLPTYGVGPIYGIVCAIITILAVVGGHAEYFSKGMIEYLRIPFILLGTILIFWGIWLWVKAVIIDKIDQGIAGNKLITSGSYAIVRNPIYSAIMIAFTGILFISGNVYFYWLPFLYWLMMTILMKYTEEKWLTKLYGKEYLEYCKKVNRCIPWFPKLEVEELYETDISEKAWIVYDILGNIGWIVYGIGFGFLIVKSTEIWKGDGWLLLFLILEGICAIGIVIGLVELINERINKLDRVLTKTRVFRGFGSITYASLAAGIVSILMLIISLTLNLKSNIHLLLLMVVGAALCYWFCHLLFKRYKKRGFA